MLTILTNFMHNQIKANYIKLAGLEKITLREHNVLPPSEVSVNGYLLSNSSNDYNTENVINFIRSIPTKNKHYYISTAADEKGNYDTYLVPLPEEKVSDALDKLYSMLVTDLRKQNPSTPETRDINLEKLGFKQDIEEQYTKSIPNQNILEKLEYQKRIVDTNQEYLLRYPSFLKQFELTSGPTFEKKNLETTLKFYQTISDTKVVRVLENQLNSAEQNDIITRNWTKLAKNLTLDTTDLNVTKVLEQIKIRGNS